MTNKDKIIEHRYIVCSFLASNGCRVSGLYEDIAENNDDLEVIWFDEPMDGKCGKYFCRAIEHLNEVGVEKKKNVIASNTECSHITQLNLLERIRFFSSENYKKDTQ